MVVLIKSDNFLAPITFLYTREINYIQNMSTQIKKITEVRQILCEFFLFHLMVKYKLTRLNVVRRKLSAFGKRANVIL